jgi:hypothetical protein
MDEGIPYQRKSHKHKRKARPVYRVGGGKRTHKLKNKV